MGPREKKVRVGAVWCSIPGDVDEREKRGSRGRRSMGDARDREVMCSVRRGGCRCTGDASRSAKIAYQRSFLSTRGRGIVRE